MAYNYCVKADASIRCNLLMFWPHLSLKYSPIEKTTYNELCCALFQQSYQDIELQFKIYLCVVKQ